MNEQGSTQNHHDNEIVRDDVRSFPNATATAADAPCTVLLCFLGLGNYAAASAVHNRTAVAFAVNGRLRTGFCGDRFGKKAPMSPEYFPQPL